MTGAVPATSSSEPAASAGSTSTSSQGRSRRVRSRSRHAFSSPRSSTSGRAAAPAGSTADLGPRSRDVRLTPAWLWFPPGISDRPEQLEEVVREARRAGACGVWANLLFLRPGTREDFPEQLSRYERLYARRAHLGAEHAKPIRAQVSEPARKHGVRDRRRTPIVPEPEPEQLALAL